MLVVDASVALKWVLQEPDSDKARALVQLEPLMAPDFILLECANVLELKARRGAIDPASVTISVAGIENTLSSLTPMRSLLPYAVVIAQELGRTVYDSLYLALAMLENATLVTSDGRFAHAALSSPAYANRVRLL